MRWCDIENDYIFIQQTTQKLNVDGKSERITSPPKTKNGRRKIPLTPSLQLLLNTQKKKQLLEKNKAGVQWQGTEKNNEEYVFANAMGAPADRNNLARLLRSTLKKASLPTRGVHALRHTFATL